MIVLSIISKSVVCLLTIGFLIKQVEGPLNTQPTTTDGSLLRRDGPLTTVKVENERLVCKLNAYGTMPKRIRSRPEQKSKKTKQTLDISPDRYVSKPKRPSIPRGCKNTVKTKRNQRLEQSVVDFNFLSFPSNKILFGTNQVKLNEREKKKEKKEVVKDDSSDELDVVFDIQEEKKNKVYEVITVMSDDETPNKITYERLYADDPDKQVLPKPEVMEDSVEIDVLNDSDIVAEVVKEAAKAKESALAVMKVEDSDKEVVNKCKEIVEIDNKSDSDSEIVCVAVLDAKTKAEQKKATIEEIFLSSDSESETRPTVPPLRLKICNPLSSNPYVNKYFQNDGSENSFGSNNSNYSLGFRQSRLYPFYGQRQMGVSNSMSDWDSFSTTKSYSTSPKASSSDDFSLTPSYSPPKLVSDETSSSVLSDGSRNKHHSSASSDNENSSSPSSSSDEEKDIYWKADRESRRKGELRYEVFTELGKKIHEGELVVNSSSFTFKVMSYNVLAQNLLEQHMYLYKDHDRRALSWTRRWALIFNEIKDENPEILCLQEVQQSHLVTHYAKLLDLGYRWVFNKRTGRYHDGVAVFYKASVFEDEEHSLVEFYQPGVSVLDRDNVGVVIRLRLRESPNHAIVIATTHLLYNPGRSDVKLAQLQVLLAEVDRLAYNKEALTYYPVILTGDFNLKPQNGAYNLITEGQLNYESLSRKNLQSSDNRNVLPRTLLPCRLGITDRCQHATVLEARVRGEECNRTKLYHSVRNRNPQQDSFSEECSSDDRFESGTLWHGFNFQSVYPHEQADGQKEASTQHGTWVTVDYIFYSTPKTKEGQKKEEGPLQLISRLRLPTQDECNRFLRHLPNFAFGSDHLPLVGKFLLRLH